MKLNKIFTFATLVAAMILTVSCHDTAADYEGPGAWDANENYADVYFQKGTDGTYAKSETVDPAAEPVATINIYRRNVSSAVSIPLTILENTDDVFTVSNADFAAGDSVATVTINYSKAGIGTPYKLVLTIDDPAYVSSYTSGVFYTYTVTRVKWNDVGYVLDENGNKVEGYAMYTDDCVTTFFGVDNVSFPTRIQERDDKKGYFRLINTYNENYIYNEPGDWDTSKDYYMYIDATNPSKVFIEHYSNTGMNWGYGNFVISSYAGYYVARGDEASAADYYGTYENGIITFPANSLLVAMMEYNSGGLYAGNGNGAFKIVLDPTKDVYTATLEDYDWEPVFSGEYTSNQLGTKNSGVTLYKGVPKEEVEAENKGCFERFEAQYGGTPYYIESPYASGKDLLFLVKNKNIVAMKDYEYQEIGLTSMNKKICANILASSQFSENEINLDIRFQTKPDEKTGEYIDYGTATETLANISWTKVGTGTYTYNVMFTQPLEDPGYEIYQRDDMPNTYKITDWFYGGDFVFTWDNKTNQCTVPISFSGYVDEEIGDIYVGDWIYWYKELANRTLDYKDYPCYYDSDTSTFHFTLLYLSADGYGWGLTPKEETLQVEWGGTAVQNRSAKTYVKLDNVQAPKHLNGAKSLFGKGTKAFAKSKKEMKSLSNAPLLVK